MIVGLTGGIACGKSTVATILRGLGATVIDADIVARAVVAPGSEALAEIRSALGSEAIAADGSLDRESVGEMVMADPSLRAQLESITHPRIRATIAQQVREALSTGAESVFVEAALLVETGGHTIYPYLWVVSCESETQIARLVKRKGCSADTAMKWIAAQMPLHEKAGHASTIIQNDGSFQQLQEKVTNAYADLMGQRRDQD